MLFIVISVVFALIAIVSLYSIYQNNFNQQKILIKFAEANRIRNEALLGIQDYLDKEIIYCSVDDNLQDKINEAQNKILVLNPGVHFSYVTDIPSNSFIIIPKNATIKLADDAKPPKKGGYVLGAHGTESNQVENIVIILNGTIDGNNLVHPYHKSGNEGITFIWAKNSTVIGSGSIVNCSGDGIDIDASTGIYLEGINLKNNSGSGIHFGSPRPIRASYKNVIVNSYSENNGFLVNRNGFDHSWPNYGVTYIGCTSKDNYRNWEIDGENGIVVASKSVNNGKVESKDTFKGLLFDTEQIDSSILKDDTIFYNVKSKQASKEGIWYQLNYNQEAIKGGIYGGQYLIAAKINLDAKLEKLDSVDEIAIFLNGKKILANKNMNIFNQRLNSLIVYGVSYIFKNDEIEVKIKIKENKEFINLDKEKSWLYLYKLEDNKNYNSDLKKKVFFYYFKQRCSTLKGNIWGKIRLFLWKDH